MPDPDHHAGTLQWAKSWVSEKGFTLDEVRETLIIRGPLLARRLLEMEKEQAEALFEAIHLEGIRAGDITPQNFKEFLGYFREVAS